VALTAQQFEAKMPDASLLLSDEPEMESSLHYAQLALLVACLEWLWRDRTDFFLGANLTIYFSRQQLKNRDYRGPDFFLVKNTTNDPRPSWVVWEEDGRYPNIIIELLSDSTAKQDRTIKKQLYQDRFRTPEYFWFSPDTLEFEGFRLVGALYIAIPADDRGWRWSEELGLFLGIHDRKLRYFTPEGDLVPNFREAVESEQARAETAIQIAQTQAAATIQAEQARAAATIQVEQARSEQLAAKLRELGIDPDHVG
jgi:Uma2 family endonuclease